MCKKAKMSKYTVRHASREVANSWSAEATFNNDIELMSFLAQLGPEKNYVVITVNQEADLTTSVTSAASHLAGTNKSRAPKSIVILFAKGLVYGALKPAEYASNLARSLSVLGFGNIMVQCGSNPARHPQEQFNVFAWCTEVGEYLYEWSKREHPESHGGLFSGSFMGFGSNNAFPRGETLKKIDREKNTLTQARLLMLLLRIEIHNNLHKIVDIGRGKLFTTLFSQRKPQSEIGDWKVLDKYVMFRQQDIRFSLTESNIMVIHVRDVFGGKQGPLNDIRKWVSDLSEKTFPDYFGASDTLMPKKVIATIGYGIDKYSVSETIRHAYNLRDIHSNATKMFPGFTENLNAGGDQRDEQISDKFAVQVIWDTEKSRIKREYTLPEKVKEMGFTLSGFVEYAERTHEELIFKPIEIYPFGQKFGWEELEGDIGPPTYTLKRKYDFFDWGQDSMVQPEYQEEGRSSFFGVWPTICTIKMKDKLNLESNQSLKRHANDSSDRLLFIEGKVEGIPHTPYDSNEQDYTDFGVDVDFKYNLSQWEEIPPNQKTGAFKKTRAAKRGKKGDDEDEDEDQDE